MSATLSAASSPSRPRSRVARLYLVLEAARPLAGGARFSLAGSDEVVVGRGDARRAKRTSEDVGQMLRIEVPDAMISSRHARIARLGAEWVLCDLGSKNGCRVNGILRERAPLRDGDLVELGGSFFLYAEETAGEGPDPGDADAAELVAEGPGLETLILALAEDHRQLVAVARSKVPVLLRGESGTGKELLARAVHNLSGRAGDFVAVNCGGLPDSLLESELFGYRKGAFSGASDDRPGLLRAADRGTLFLDEIGDLPPGSQAALLRALQEGEVRSVGATRSVRVDVRAVSATHRDLDTLVARGTFRADLLARLDGFRAELRPLRERRGDLGMLVSRLLSRLDADRAASVTFSSEAARALLSHSFPLNVRELEQALGAALALAPDGRIELAALPERLQNLPPSAAAERHGKTEEHFDDRLREELIRLLDTHAGNISAVARAMGKDRTQIRRWIRRFKLAGERPPL